MRPVDQVELSVQVGGRNTPQNLPGRRLFEAPNPFMQPLWLENCLESRQAGNMLDGPKDFYNERFEPKPGLVRLMERMKSRIQALFVIVLAGTLAVSALACPLWMASLSQPDMPCSNQDSAHEKCPVVICLASSSYLQSDARLGVPVLQQMPGELAGANPILALTGSAELIQADAEPPPGFTDPLYLRTHSFLI